MASLTQGQSCRWVFTLNNYDEQVNYKEHHKRFDVIKRGVWGFEIAPQTGTRHLQGYLEFKRSQRLKVCMTVHPTARWDKAVENATVNYEYCTKSGRFGTVGDWSKIEAGNQQPQVRPLSVPLIIAGLINPATAPQIKLSKEYADRYTYCDRVTNLMKKMISDVTDFNIYKNYKLYPWQNEVSCLISIHCIYL